MSSVCLSVCLRVCPQDISGTTRAIITIFVHVAYGRGSVLFQQGDEIPRGKGNFGGFPPHWQYTSLFTKKVAQNNKHTNTVI